MLRRSRMKRSRTGKNLALTERDLSIFRLLVRYRYLRSTYIHAYVGGASETRLKERLGDLYHEGYLDRPAQQWEYAEARCSPAIYELGSGGRRALALAEEIEAPITFLTGSTHRQFQHSVLICECLASFELATHQALGLRFIAWPEILARAPAGTRVAPMPFRIPLSVGVLIPDGIFGLEYERAGTKAYRFFALEVDRGTMPVVRSTPGQSSYAKKIITYRDVVTREVHCTHLGIPNLIVLTVTTSEARKDQMLTVVNSVSEPRAEVFLFKVFGTNLKSAPDPSLLMKAWERAGHVPLTISSH